MLTVGMVIPYYNCEEYIGECLKSVAEQTRIPDYVIVVDDASAPHETETAARLCREHGFLSASHKVNWGPSAARNSGIRALLEMPVRPDIFICLDADDIIAPGYVEMMVDALDEHPAAWVAYPEIQMFGFEQRVIRTPKEYTPGKLLASPFIVSASAWRTQMWEEIYRHNGEGWDTRADRWGWEDYLFWMEGLLGVRRGSPNAAVHVGPDKFWFLYRRFNRLDRSDGNETKQWEYFARKMRGHYGVTLPPPRSGGIER